jgi:hypothetical protein
VFPPASRCSQRPLLPLDHPVIALEVSFRLDWLIIVCPQSRVVHFRACTNLVPWRLWGDPISSFDPQLLPEAGLDVRLQPLKPTHAPALDEHRAGVEGLGRPFIGVQHDCDVPGSPAPA